MKVLLLEPPAAGGGCVSFEPAEHRVFAPPWLLLCVWSYLRERTRHECFFSDARLYTDIESELVSAVELSNAEVVVVHVEPSTTAEAACIFDILKRHFPSITTVACGSHPSQFVNASPDLARADYALAGDPEPILRDLLEYYNLPRKLLRVRGLLARWMPPGRGPAWLDDLRSLSLPDWTGVLWSAYAGPDKRIRASARLTRGHSRSPADRAYGDHGEPLRIWPMERLAVAIQKSTAQSIHEVFLSDPPGVWTLERLSQWCQALMTVRNTQHWSFRMLPTLLSSETIEALVKSNCTRVEFLFPSVLPHLLERYGCTVKPGEFRATLYALESAGIRAHLRFWLAGPESPTHEPRHILKVIRMFNYPTAAFETHPFRPDSPLSVEHPVAQKKLADWLEWIKDPWMHSKPALTWTHDDPTAYLTASVRYIEKAVRLDPRRRLRHLWAHLTGRNWIVHWETRAAEAWTAVNIARDLDQRSK